MDFGPEPEPGFVGGFEWPLEQQQQFVGEAVSQQQSLDFFSLPLLLFVGSER